MFLGLNYSEYFLTPANIIVTLLTIIVLLVIISFKSNALSNKEDALWYRINAYEKMVFSSIFAIYYIVIFQGGDTSAYWQTMGALKGLMFKDFGDFWYIVTTEPTMEKLSGYFNYETTYPPRFIYMEEESFNVTKVLLPLRILTFDSYLACTLVLSLIASNATWGIYKIARNLGLFNKNLLLLTVLLVPSVAFWASGISKDTIIYISIVKVFYALYHIIYHKDASSSRIKYWISILFFGYLIFEIRPFILVALLAPLAMMYILGKINRIKDFSLLRNTIKLALFAGIIMMVGFAITRMNMEEMLQNNATFSEAIVIQQDFQNNTGIYGADDGKRYSLGEVDFSLTGIIKALPASIIAGIYRPFMREALSLSLILNGFESMLLLILTVRFFTNNFKKRVQLVMQNELLLFAFAFVIIIAFMAGFTSILFGVLVRIRAPLLPFLGLLLSLEIMEKTETKELLDDVGH